MLSPKERLTHLLELAGQGPAARVALTGELTDLLLDWPEHYPAAMRTPFVVLLEKTVRQVGPDTRAALAQRFIGHDELPTELLNEFFLEAPETLKDLILAHNAAANDDAAEAPACDGAALLEAARRGEAFAVSLSKTLGIACGAAEEILEDATGRSLAVACKGARLDRATYSAIALLSAPQSADTQSRLSIYETVPQAAAENLLRFWRARNQAVPETSRAAE